MIYKGYFGSVEYSEADNLFFGKVLGIGALISYEGETINDLIADFHTAVDDYLIECAAIGKKPEQTSEEFLQRVRLEA